MFKFKYAVERIYFVHLLHYVNMRNKNADVFQYLYYLNQIDNVPIV